MINRMFWEPSSYSRVYSDYFKLSDFTNSKSGKRVLIISANIPKKLSTKRPAQLAYFEDDGKSAVVYTRKFQKNKRLIVIHIFHHCHSMITISFRNLLMDSKISGASSLQKFQLNNKTLIMLLTQQLLLVALFHCLLTLLHFRILIISFLIQAGKVN